MLGIRTFTSAPCGGDRERRTPRARPMRTTSSSISQGRFRLPRHDPMGGSSGRSVVHTPRDRETGRADGRRAAYHCRAPVGHDPEQRHAHGVADLLHGRQHPGGREALLRRDPGQHGDRLRGEDRPIPKRLTGWPVTMITAPTAITCRRRLIRGARPPPAPIRSRVLPSHGPGLGSGRGEAGLQPRRWRGSRHIAGRSTLRPPRRQ